MNASLVASIKKAVGRGTFKADRPFVEGFVDLPRTMRELIEGPWTEADREHWAPAVPVFSVDQFFKLPPTMRSSPVPVSAEQLIAFEPGQPSAEMDLRNWAPVCHAFHGWLTMHGRTVAIDHSLGDWPWPIVELFEKELNARQTGMEEIFWCWDFGEENERDQVTTGQAYIPVWDMQRDDESVPLIEFLHGLQGVIHKDSFADDVRWPEEVYEDGDGRDADTAMRVLTAICRQRRWRLLKNPWRSAMAALAAYPHWPVGCYEIGYDWWVEPIESAADIASLFDILEKVKAMFAGVLPLLMASTKDPIFQALITHLLKILRRHPDLLENQPLREVLNDGQKVTIKI